MELTGSTFILDNGKLEEISGTFSAGAGIRALAGGAWGFTITEDTGEIRKAIEHASLLAARTQERTPREKVTLAPVKKPHLRNLPVVKKDPLDVPVEDKIELLKDIEKALRIKEVNSTSVTYSEIKARVHYSSSEGVDCEYKSVRVGFAVSAVAQRNGTYQADRESRFSVCGFELFDRYDAREIASEVGGRAVALLDAKAAKGGEFPVILDPELAGVFIHEAVGHAVEADHVLEGNSILSGKINTQVGSPLLTAIDDPTLHEYGYYPIDSEGVESRPRVLIENGVLKSYLHSRETAGKLGGEPGNARAQSYSKPVVRMSNTFIANGSSTFDEMLLEIRDGVYLIGSRGGQVNPGEGIFQFNAKRGYMIENGKIAAPLRDVSLSGSTLEILHNVTMVGNDMGLHSGRCGKAGQLVPVTDGAPHVLVSRAMVGGSG
ncbi:MAG TPA: TldD/PmbA family protein [Candidatus Methanoperedenaceae archaeon]|nr:TldD/PmbA family protein [Candidatus Methanoperedenaceae archaeon]